MRQLWRVRLRNPRQLEDNLAAWVAHLPDEMALVMKGNEILAEFAKEHNLQHYVDDEVIKISEEERLMLILKLDTRLILEKMP